MMDSANLEQSHLNVVRGDSGRPSTPSNQSNTQLGRREGGNVQFGNQPQSIEVSSLTLKITERRGREPPAPPKKNKERDRDDKKG